MVQRRSQPSERPVVQVGLKILVTSRAVLHLSIEQVVPVAPLSLPSLSTSDNEDIAQSAAVTLFVQRARNILPSFQLTPRNARAIAEVCVRLDGLPLAIELAAARVKLLPPQVLLARLSQRLQLLTGGPRSLPVRQQTLRGTIQWSYDLLGPAALLSPSAYWQLPPGLEERSSKPSPLMKSR